MVLSFSPSIAPTEPLGQLCQQEASALSRSRQEYSGKRIGRGWCPFRLPNAQNNPSTLLQLSRFSPSLFPDSKNSHPLNARCSPSFFSPVFPIPGILLVYLDFSLPRTSSFSSFPNLFSPPPRFFSSPLLHLKLSQRRGGPRGRMFCNGRREIGRQAVDGLRAGLELLSFPHTHLRALCHCSL